MSAAPRPLRLYASLWSLRGYPTSAREWSWPRKFAAIAAAGFDGVYSPPIPELRRRGALRYRAVMSVRTRAGIAPAMTAAAGLGAESIDFQLGTPATATPAAVALLREIRRQSRRLGLPFAVETHRGTCTETPERTRALLRAYRAATGEPLPVCADHAHVAVVRHLAPPFWPALRRPAEVLAASQRFHLRPCNGHHAQLPVLTRAGRRSAEYRVWLDYVRELFAHLAARRDRAELVVVPEIGHERPAYRLADFPDTWRDARALSRDLRRLWSAAVRARAAQKR